MKLKLLIAALALATTGAHATCSGTGSYRTCTDNQSGSTYSTYGTKNYSNTQGYNPQTRSHWNQQTWNYGGMGSQTTGKDSRGRQWSQRTQRMGNRTIYSGRDASGNNYYYSCDDKGNCY